MKLFSRIKALFKKGVEEFDKKNPSLKIDAMIEHNNGVIKDCKSQITQLRSEKYSLDRELNRRKDELSRYVLELKKAKNEGRDCSIYIKQVKAQEELVEKIKQSISQNEKLYQESLVKITAIENKNKEIGISKNIYLTKLSLAKLKETSLNITTDGVFSADDIIEEINKTIDGIEARYDVEKDLGNVKEDPVKNYDDESVDEILARYN